MFGEQTKERDARRHRRLLSYNVRSALDRGRSGLCLSLSMGGICKSLNLSSERLIICLIDINRPLAVKVQYFPTAQAV